MAQLGRLKGAATSLIDGFGRWLARESGVIQARCTQSSHLTADCQEIQGLTKTTRTTIMLLSNYAQQLFLNTRSGGEVQYITRAIASIS